MIVFNTVSKANHYVRYCNRVLDYSRGGYDYSVRETFIKDGLVLAHFYGDSCGCGCDNYRYNYYEVLGRIKRFDTVSNRDYVLKSLL